MILKNAKVLYKEKELIDADIYIKNGRIEKVGELADINDEVIDLKGKTILPGFIDNHNHGAMGHWFKTPDVDFDELSSFFAEQGITGMLATTSTAPISSILESMKSIADGEKKRTKGTKILGIHAEGPFLSKRRKGAMDESNIISATPELIDEMLSASEGLLKVITIAPEEDANTKVITYAAKKGINCSIGHTDSTYEEAVAAIDAGAASSTHTFNGMRPLSHRDPGVLGAVLTDDRVYCEVICDFYHVNPAIVKMIYKLKGAEKMIVISDTVPAAGIKTETFVLDGTLNYIRDGLLIREDGVINGSVRTLKDGFKNLLSIGIPLADISRMISGNPARLNGLFEETGSIEEGKLADLTVTDDEGNIFMTIINGEIEFNGML